jgi:amino acid adenylation domain-containing protein
MDRKHSSIHARVSSNQEQNGDAVAVCITEAERRQLATWNETRHDFPTDACIPQLIAERARETPDALALAAVGQKMTYAELNRRANQLAHYLRQTGVQPAMPVGLYIDRSLDMVVGLLGILKAGGAYVPIDPQYPARRVSFILEDAGVSILVTRQSLLSALEGRDQSGLYARAVCLDSDREMLDQQSATEPPVTCTADQLVYIVYTSGSTGQPKGVLVTHRNLLNLIFWHRRAYAVTPDDRATQVASPAFDATGWELWPYLTLGASVHFPDEETRVTPAALRDWLVEQRITIAFLPTALAERMLTLDWPAATALRRLLTGADTLRRYPTPDLPFTLINNYGPTEATVVTTFGPVAPAAAPDRLPTIGKSIDNVQVYLLDEQMQQVPIGAPGELFIGGAGVAKGYHNRPELTSEKFVSDPFNSDPAARLYRTGDRARFLPDGQLAFLGRTDSQLKIRGYRIEQEEIVAALNAHPAVQASVVTACEDSAGEKQLVAYLVLLPGETPTTTDLQNALKTRLPDYMIPATFVRLDALPITPNGKTDYAALPSPDADNTLQNDAFVAPDTPVEERVAAIVAELLHLERVSIDDNFFLLGGHSLLGTQLIARISDAFGLALSLRVLFNAPTVRQLAAEIEQQMLEKLAAMSEEEVQRLLQYEHSL